MSTAHSTSWITESIVQFSYSPMWRNPVNNFIDDHCFFFDNETEMKLEYTKIHNEFKSLIDTLLTNFVKDLGISLQTAMEAIGQSVDDPMFVENRQANRFMQYIFAADDFRSFHRMMVKRNIELDIIATAELAKRGIHLTPPVLPDDSDIVDDLAYTANGDLDESEAMQLAIQASLQESEGITDRQLALQDAILQEKLAMDVHKEKVKALHSVETVRNQVRQLATRDIQAAQQLEAQQMVRIQQTKEANILSLEQKALMARQQNVERSVTAEQEQMELSVASIGSKVLESTNAPSPKNKSAEMNKKARPVVTPKKGFGLSALPPISQPPLEELKAAAVANASSPQKSVPKAPTNKATPAPTKEEMEARAKYMREQRKMIIEKNKAARQQELNEYAQKNGATANGQQATNAQAENKKLTADIARRLREDLIQETKK